MNQVMTIGTAILKRHGFFSIDQVMEATKISRRYCRDILALLCREGLTRQITKGRKEHVPGMSPMWSTIYRVIDRKKLSARIAPRRIENTVQDRMWSVIRNKSKNGGSFNLHDLTILAGAKRQTARWYLKALRRAGYIEPSRNAGPGVEWRLTGNFGGRRPRVNYSPKLRRRKL